MILFSFFCNGKIGVIIVSLCQFRNIKISLFSQNISYIGSMQNVDGPERQIQNNKWTMKHARCVCFHNFIYLLVLFCRKEYFKRMQYSIEKRKIVCLLTFQIFGTRCIKQSFTIFAICHKLPVLVSESTQI